MMEKEELFIESKPLEASLFKLDSNAEVLLNLLKANGRQQEKDLNFAQAEADQPTQKFSKAISDSTSYRNEIGEMRLLVAENEEKVNARKAEIENELSESQSVLDAAKQAVGQIKSAHLNEIRSFVTPPETIFDVLAAVLMLLGMKDLSWTSMTKFLSKRGVKDDIINYDAKRTSPELRKKVAKFLEKKPLSFDGASVRGVSVTVAPMAAWVKAIICYSLAIETIEPLQAELEEEIVKLEQSRERLKRCEEEVKESRN